MKQKYYLGALVLAFSLVAFSAFVLEAKAQETTTQAQSTTTAELGVTDPGILPTNPFYFVKEWGRGFRVFFTFNSVAKTDLELKIANEKAAELKKIQEVRPQDAQAVSKALENYRTAQERLKSRFESLRETSQNPNVDKLLDKLADRLVKHEKVIDEVIAKFGDNEDVKRLAESTKERLDETITKAAEKDDPAKFISKLEKALVETRGDELKHLKSIEIIDRLEQRAPEKVRESLERLREDFSQRLAKDVGEFLNKNNEEAFKKAVQGRILDPVRLSVILEQVREKAERRVAEALEEVTELLEEAVERETDVAKRAEEQIKDAEERIQKLEAKLKEIAAPPQVVLNLAEEALGNLKEAKVAFEDKKFGEAFGQARSAEVLARNALRILEKERPQAGDLEQEMNELAAKIEKYEALLKEKGFTPEKNPKAYLLLADGKKHLGFAREGFAKNDLASTKLHIGHVKGYLRDLARLLEERVEEKRVEKPAPVLRVEVARCEEIRRSLSELEEMLKSGTISKEDYSRKYEVLQKELANCKATVTPQPVEKPIVCTEEYNPVCGVNGLTYSNECKASVAGVKIAYRGKCQVKMEPTDSSIAPTPVKQEPTATTVSPALYEFKIEADDGGFYPSGTISAPKGSKVKIHFIVRSTNVYFGGLDFRSPKFKTESVKPGGITTVEFLADESFEFSSYWPASGVLKATGKVAVQ